MDKTLYLAIGFLLLLSAILIIKKKENVFFSPATIIFSGYFMHFFAHTWLLYTDGHPELNENSWETLSFFNLYSYLALMMGYLITIKPLNKKKYTFRNNNLNILFSRKAMYYVSILTVTVISTSLVLFYLSGVFSQGRVLIGEFAYTSAPATFTLANKTLTLSLPLSIALFYSAHIDRGLEQRRLLTYSKLLSYLSVGLIVLYDILTFGRGSILYVLVTLFLIFYFRTNVLKMKHYILTFLSVFFVLIFSMFRGVGSGLSNISLSGFLNLQSSFDHIIHTIPGQLVLSNVIAYYESGQRNYFYGLTFLNSLVSKIPFLNLNNNAQLHPSFWYYQNILGGGDVFSGRDFAFAAEAYMNFGFFGFLIFFFIGMLTRYLSYKIYETKNPLMLIWASMMIINLLLLLRSHSYKFLTVMIYFVVVIYLIKKITKKQT